MTKRKAWPAPNLFARYSVAGLADADKIARRPSLACIRHFVREAAKAKADAAARLADQKWMRDASDMAQSWTRDTASRSIHAIARKALEYARMRAFLTVSPERAGSYAPAGWPIDRPARDQWQALNPPPARDYDSLIGRASRAAGWP
ncbi:hypothetical protein CcrColossus_gp020 [Caulobacter phage CcrColossus]|uniref:Uncharacterized protein n=1 Tax=Caulobacter phage CcrColossus TaxID=1211640 RepID=K4JU99_9CAUD|nr:hypothetical protein CcrColossus_gp020 [Caulobacter phage CcrColossus]AFU87890.1 hypothetical protein CcrColossus_gp020 [Caulobacter phage CcrColossus]